MQGAFVPEDKIPLCDKTKWFNVCLINVTVQLYKHREDKNLKHLVYEHCAKFAS